MAVETLAQRERQHSQYIDFWNSVLVPKFIRWKHILVDGLTLHSEAIFPTLPVKPGDKVVDAGCGFGDTAIKLARLVDPSGWLSIVVMHFWNSVVKTRRLRG
jgi:ubiquinone/menaquinone biosynthesis C-methylase UbiE